VSCWRDGYYWDRKKRRESGEDKREFEELLKRDWEDFERQQPLAFSWLQPFWLPLSVF
jgi:hypothetical protein